MSLKYEKLIRKMTLAEKAIMMSGKNTWETVDFEKYGVRKFSDSLIPRASPAPSAISMYPEKSAYN